MTLNAMEKASENRFSKPVQSLVHHSEKGVQYASKDYVNCLKIHDLRISASRRGNPHENAFVESFITTLKCEEVYLDEYGTFEDALRNIWHFTKKVYNQKRLAFSA